jgi:two-component system chemotaxis response regulator CheB
MSRLGHILARAARLPAATARDGDQVLPGHILVAPPGSHLLIPDGVVRLSTGPRVNRHRPAVDVMFASVAKWAGAGATGLILSGTLDDGALGCALIERAGGQVFVQDPSEAEFAGMPRAAVRAAPSARITKRSDLVRSLIDAVPRDVGASAPYGDKSGEGRSTMVESPASSPTLDMAASGDPAYLAEDEARVVRLSCPDCGGGMAQIELPTISYFRCHVGHQYSPQSLLAAQIEAAENKLWSAVAALEEQAATARFLAIHDQQQNGPSADDTMRRAQVVADQARALRSQTSQNRSGPEQIEA